MMLTSQDESATIGGILASQPEHRMAHIPRTDRDPSDPRQHQRPRAHPILLRETKPSVREPDP